MKDEEMARLFIINKYDLRKDLQVWEIKNNLELCGEYHSFLEGLKAGRTQAKKLLADVYKIAMEDWNDPKWHDQVLKDAREYLKEIEK